MLLEIILAIELGIIIGIFTGLSPGIHINLIASILLASISNQLFSSIQPLSLALFIVSMSITHTIIDFIPSIYLGAPEEDTFLSILPGHQLMKQGLAHTAFILTMYGSLVAIPIILIYTPIFIKFLPIIFTSTKTIMPFLLIFISFYLIFREEKTLVSIFIFLLAGILGFTTFNLPIKEPLLPLLSGLFGLSGLFLSLNSTSKPQKQTIQPLKEIALSKNELLKSSLSAFLIAPFFSFLPGLGSSHATTISSELFNLKTKSFLFLNGAVNTIIMGLSFVTVYTIGKSRTGSAATVLGLLDKITKYDLIIILTTIVIVAILSFIIGIYLSKLAAKFINIINYKSLTICVITIIILINIILSNWVGLLVLITSTSLGIFTIQSNSRRINLMAALIVPAIIYYLMN
ncbi:MAG: tripartite tricarboxylate transporter permease [Nanoarchaeota archaeon]